MTAFTHQLLSTEKSMPEV